MIGNGKLEQQQPVFLVDKTHWLMADEIERLSQMISTNTKEAELFFDRYLALLQSKPSVETLAISSVFPSVPSYPTEQLMNALISTHFGGDSQLLPVQKDFIERIFERSRILKSHVSLPPEKLFKRLTLTEYTTHIKSALQELAMTAARNCFEQLAKLSSGDINPQNIETAKNSITHLVFGTMTNSVAAPSMDIHLALNLGLSPHVKRLNVESMGCLTGFRLIGLCKDLVLQNPRVNRVLLIVCDIRSALGNMMTSFDPSQSDGFSRTDVIVSALFRDGGAAAVFGVQTSSDTAASHYADTPFENYPRRASGQTSSQKGVGQRRLEVTDHLSYLIPNSLDHAWVKQHDDGSQQLFLSKDLPDCIERHLPSILEPLLIKHKVEIGSCLFAVHTGGPRVINGVCSALKLSEEQVAASWWVMVHKGNLSGSSNLIVVDFWLQYLNGTLKPDTDSSSASSSDSNSVLIDGITFPINLSKYKHIIGVSFGPGVGVEVVLFTILAH